MYACNGGAGKSGVTGIRDVWQSTDKCEATRVLDEVFGVTIDEEGPGTFTYTQRHIWEKPAATAGKLC